MKHKSLYAKFLLVLTLSRYTVTDAADFGGRFDDSGVKNGEERLIVLNKVALSIINEQRGQHPKWVFSYKDSALHRMNGSAWRKARVRAADKWEEINGMPAHPGFRSFEPPISSTLLEGGCVQLMSPKKIGRRYLVTLTETSPRITRGLS